MQQLISDTVNLTQSLNPANGVQKVKSVDYNSNFLLNKVDKLKILLKKAEFILT